MDGVAARFAGARLLGLGLDRSRNAAALGGLKRPIMEVAQLLMAPVALVRQLR